MSLRPGSDAAQNLRIQFPKLAVFAPYFKRPVIIHQAIRKSEINDQRGYLKVAGRFFSTKRWEYQAKA